MSDKLCAPRSIRHQAWKSVYMRRSLSIMFFGFDERTRLDDTICEETVLIEILYLLSSSGTTSLNLRPACKVRRCPPSFALQIPMTSHYRLPPPPRLRPGIVLYSAICHSPMCKDGASFAILLSLVARGRKLI